MFNIAAKPTFKRTIKVGVPSDKGHEEQTFSATFKVIAAEKANEFALNTEAGSAEFLRTVVVRLDDIVGDDKQIVPYSEEVLEQVIALPYARIPLARAYMDAVAGAKSGN